MTRLLLLLSTFAFITSDLFGQFDSASFSFENYREIVLKNHPLIRQAALQEDRGESQLRKTKGLFDPKLEGSYITKEYDRKTYYELNNAQLKLATPFAVELKAGFDLNDGYYLNEQEITPDNGLFTAGISVPVLQGLVMDERRTALRQAKAYVEFTNAEKIILTNDVLIRAYNAYWDWWASTERLKIGTDIQRIAKDRFDAVKARAIAGQAPMIDTLEAYIQFQVRTQNLGDLRANEIKNRMMLTSFIWNSDNQAISPVVLTSKVQPEAPVTINSEFQFYYERFISIHDTISDANPLLRQYDSKLESLYADQKWKQEKLKPKLNLQYNALSTPTSSSDVGFSTNNYKWGLEFSFPLFLREARGDLQMARIKIAETQLDLTQKKQELKNKSLSVYQQIDLIQDQIRIAETNRDNYFQLLEAERTKFFLGESSLFLVNQREMQYADASNKVIDLKVKLENSRNEMLFLLGVIR